MGLLKYAVSGGTTYPLLFPVGTPGVYSPMTIQGLSAASYAPDAYITGRPIVSTTGFTDYSQRFFTVTSSGINSISDVRPQFALNYPADIIGSPTEVKLFVNSVATTVAGGFFNTLTGVFGVNATGNTLLDGEWAVEGTLCPILSGILPLSTVPGSSITLAGINMHQVSSVILTPRLAVPYFVANTQNIVVTIPAEALTGTLTLVGACGNVISSQTLTIQTLSVSGITIGGSGGITIISNPGGNLIPVVNYEPIYSNATAVGWTLVPPPPNGIAVIDPVTGVVTAFGNGLVTIVGTVGTVSGSFVVSISGQLVSATGITIGGSGGLQSITASGGTFAPTVSFEPFNASLTTVGWSLEPTGLATIDLVTGVVTATGNGVLTIVGTTGTVTGIYVITISGQPVSVSGLTIGGAAGIQNLTAAGQTLQPTTTFYPLDATLTTVGWSASPASGVVTIDPFTGLITAVANGIVTITGTVGTVTSSFVITVTNICTTGSANFSYANTLLCSASSSIAPTGVFANGFFISHPAGLTIESITGVVQPATSVASNYQINYIIPATFGCLEYTVSGVVVTVVSTPTISGLSNTSICSGSSTSLSISGTNPASVYTYLVSGTTGAVTGASGGTGNIIAQALEGNGSVTYQIGANANGCFASPINVSVNVQGIPSMAAVSNQLICSGNNMSITYSSPVPGTTFFTSLTTSVGVTGASGSATNPLLNVLSGYGFAKYSVLPVANGCTGTGISFDAIVSRSPTLTLNLSMDKAAYCSGTNGLLIIQNAEQGIVYNARINGISAFNNASGAGVNLVLTIPSNLFTLGNNNLLVEASDAFCGSGTMSTTPVVTYYNPPSTQLSTTALTATICGTDGIILGISNSQTNIAYQVERQGTSVSNSVAGTGAFLLLNVPSGIAAEGNNIFSIRATSLQCNESVVLTSQPAVYSQPIPSVILTEGVAICSGTELSYTPQSEPAGATFGFNPGVVSGTVSGMVSGVGNSIVHTLTGSGILEYNIAATLNGCTGVTTAVPFTILGVPDLEKTVVGDSVCAREDAIFTLKNTETGVVYSWLNHDQSLLASKVGDGSDWVLTVAAGAIAASGEYPIKAQRAQCAEVMLSQKSSLTLLSLPSKPVVQVSKTSFVLCDKFNTTLSGTPGYASSYQWYMDDVKIAGAVYGSYMPVTTAKYTVRGFSENGCFSTSDASEVILKSVLAKPTIQVGGSTDLDTVLTSSLAEAYQWYVGKKAIVGATARSYFPKFIAAYQVRINPGATCTDISDIYVLNNSQYDELARYEFEQTDSTIDLSKPRIKHEEWIVAYPNPAKDKVNVKVLKKGKSPNMTWILYNAMGVIVRESTVPTKGYEAEWELPRDDLPTGLYTLVVSEGVNTQRINLVFE